MEHQRKREECIFCKRSLSNLIRHVITRHPHEPRVKEIMALHKTDARRAALVGKLRTEGYVVMSAGEKVILRKGGKVEYVSCECCGAFFGRNTDTTYNAVAANCPKDLFQGKRI